jgi:uncharacterized protein (TIRG00374 family)
VRWRLVRYAGGCLLAAVALYACFARTDWAQVVAACRIAQSFWVVVALGSVMLTLALVTERWSMLLGRDRARPSWGALWDAVVVGQAVNIVFPLRFGEGARVAMTCGAPGLSLGRVTMVLAFERTLDVTAFATVVLVLISAGALPSMFAGIVPSVVLLTGATMAAVALAVWAGPRALGWLRRRFGRPGSAVSEWLERQQAGIERAQSDVRLGRRLPALIIMTALILLSSASTNWLIFRAFELPVPPTTALVLLAVLQVGTAIVSVPGNVGVFHYLTVLTLTAWHIPRADALAVAIVLHVISLGPRVILGAVAAASLRGRRVRAAASDGARL